MKKKIDKITNKKPTHWTLGYSLDAELGYDDGKYLPRKAALLLYPEYFDEHGEPRFDMLPVGKLNYKSKGENT
ncbi:MAG: hypothetical protein IKY26_09550 [Erysipelotrichaceae bacterium]|nr:hypothetical protein [Erysipelotrichaceae bacterium]